LEVLVSASLYHRLCEAAGQSQVAPEAWVCRAITERLERESGGSRADALAALRRIEGPTADIDDMIAEIAAGRRIQEKV